MTRTLTTVVPLVLAIATAGLVAPTASSASSSACVPGATTIAGKKAIRFCGPAKASAKVGAKTFAFSGGACQVSGVYFTLNIGAIIVHKVANSKPGPTPYFGVTVTPSNAGVHLSQVLTWTSGGKAYSVLGSHITLKSGLKSGSFTGRSIDGKKVTGSFTCG